MSELNQEKLEDTATKFVNEVVPAIYQALERAGISYDDEMVCVLLSDGFKAGYMQRVKEEEV